MNEDLYLLKAQLLIEAAECLENYSDEDDYFLNEYSNNQKAAGMSKYDDRMLAHNISAVKNSGMNPRDSFNIRYDLINNNPGVRRVREYKHSYEGTSGPYIHIKSQSMDDKLRSLVKKRDKAFRMGNKRLVSEYDKLINHFLDEYTPYEYEYQKDGPLFSSFKKSAQRERFFRAANGLNRHRT